MEQNRGEETQRFKKGGKLGQGVGALKGVGGGVGLEPPYELWIIAPENGLHQRIPLQCSLLLATMMPRFQNIMNVQIILKQGLFLRHDISRRIMPGADPGWFKFKSFTL